MVARLKELRKRKGISQQHLAEVIGISQQSVNKYENQGVEPDIWTLITLADFFNTSVDYLIGHTDVDRVIEPVQSYDLNDDEANLVDHWRKLDASQKQSLRLVIDNYLK